MFVLGLNVRILVGQLYVVFYHKDKFLCPLCTNVIMEMVELFAQQWAHIPPLSHHIAHQEINTKSTEKINSVPTNLIKGDRKHLIERVKPKGF